MTISLLRPFRPALACCILSLAATGMWLIPLAAAKEARKSAAAPEPGESVSVSARPIAFSSSSQKTSFGRLIYRGGVQITSESKDFGGFSGLSVDADGDLFAISDEGSWLKAHIVHQDGRLTGVEEARMGRIAGGGGKVYRGKAAHDAEGLRVLPGGKYLISFERRHRIGEFAFKRGQLRLIRNLKLPRAVSYLTRNRGLEAIAAFKGGKELAFFAERKLDATGNHTGWYFRNGKFRRLSVARSDEFDQTDAVALPDGSLLLLERRFVNILDGVHMRLRLVSRKELEGDGPIQGEVLFRGSNFGYAVDNMEGVAAYRNKDGETIVNVISDDNFNHVLQRTLLLEFALAPAPGQAPAVETATERR
jgi:hypothetical protein